MRAHVSAAAAALGLLASPVPVPTPIGAGAAYRPGPESPAVRRALPVAGLACSTERRRRFGVHVELFANRLAVVVPAGIGIAPPLRRSGAFVAGGRCSYPLRTTASTGVVEVEEGRRLTLGDLFAVWGRALSSTRLLDVRAPTGGRVLAFVNGRSWPGEPAAIPLARHAQIVLEIGGLVPPHTSFLFPKGLS